MAVVLALIALTVHAQDPFEIQIYEYETVPKGMWNLETHINNEQVHQLFPGGDLKFGKNVVVNFGVGFGATEAGNRLVYKMRIGYLFGKKK
jgi:hypothetical protein